MSEKNKSNSNNPLQVYLWDLFKDERQKSNPIQFHQRNSFKTNQIIIINLNFTYEIPLKMKDIKNNQINFY